MRHATAARESRKASFRKSRFQALLSLAHKSLVQASGPHSWSGSRISPMPYELNEWEHEPETQASSSRGGIAPRKITGVGIFDLSVPPTSQGPRPGGVHVPASPGQYLKAVRERLQLEMRAVQDASMVIASEEGNENFYVSPARLTQIENDESIPSFYKLFSLCQIYGLDFHDVLSRYGVPRVAGSRANTGGFHTTLETATREGRNAVRPGLLLRFLQRLWGVWRRSTSGSQGN